jgi:hypothetical protein
MVFIGMINGFCYRGNAAMILVISSLSQKGLYRDD